MTTGSLARGWGWAGSVQDFLLLSAPDFVESLSDHHAQLGSTLPSGSQVRAWTTEHDVMAAALRSVVDSNGTANGWGIVFEYELPLEGGRRPDVVVLAGETVVVLEFKDGMTSPSLAAVDQVAAYARNLAEYHEVTHQYRLGPGQRSVIPVLVLTQLDSGVTDVDHALVSGRSSVDGLLRQLSTGGSIDLERWLLSPYAPLPTLVRAAKTIFEHEDLPHVRRARSARVPETVDLVLKLADDARRTQLRHLILVSGVPGAGKTLVGLRAVYEHSSEAAQATFLSGNGPLVKVLQDALKSSVFVKDLHAYIRTYGINARQPKEHVVVFDEAQRAWDRAYMSLKRQIDRSEPELLIDAAMRLPGWAAFVGLVGDGQEIHSGEEGGLRQWAEAIESSAAEWVIHCPPRVASSFAGLNVVEHELLDLTTSLRSREAERLHDWVAHLLSGEIGDARRVADDFQNSEFTMYLSRDLDEIAAYCRDRYADDPLGRYGLVASSHAKNLVAHGVDNSWIATSRMRLARWYNADSDDPHSCCQLAQPVTEFGCQGLELDMPVVAWGSDMLWSGRDWTMRPVRRRFALEDPEAILTNVYRVLLTRGRDGFVVFVPPAPAMDLTAEALKASGLIELAEAERAVRFSVAS